MHALIRRSEEGGSYGIDVRSFQTLVEVVHGSLLRTAGCFELLFAVVGQVRGNLSSRCMARALAAPWIASVSVSDYSGLKDV